MFHEGRFPNVVILLFLFRISPSKPAFDLIDDVILDNMLDESDLFFDCSLPAQGEFSFDIPATSFPKSQGSSKMSPVPSVVAPNFPWLSEIVPPAGFADAAAQSATTVQKALSMIKQFPSNPELSQEQFFAALAERKLLDEFYTPGSTTRCMAGWEILFQELGDLPEVREIKGILTGGYKLQFENPFTTGQQNRPGNAGKEETLLQLLTSTYGQTEALRLMAATELPSIHLLNFKSAAQHSGFVDQSVQELLQFGVIATWPKGSVPHQINPIGVAVKHEKLRLVTGPMAVNRYEQYVPIGYESPQQILDFLQPGDWTYKQDAMKGYFLLPIHPDSYQYLAFEWNGVIYYYRFLPFGLSSACAVYTRFMRLVNLLPRKFGEQLMQYIDDRFSAARTQGGARFRSLATVLLMDGLGIFTNKKSCITPQQTMEMLGLEFVTNYVPPDLPGQQFVQVKVPHQKLQRLQAAASSILNATVTTRRFIASLAGKLISCSLAMPLARSHIQFLYEFIKIPRNWDEQLFLDDGTKSILRWIVKHLVLINGHAVRKPLRPNGVKLVVDTSDFQHGAAVFDLASNQELWQITEILPKEFYSGSSTLREARGIAYVVQQAIHWMKRHGYCHKYLRMHCINDNQGAVADFRHLKAGKLDILEQVHAVNSLAIENDIEFSIEWHPRTAPDAQLADALSRAVDPSDFRMGSTYANQICAFPLSPKMQSLLERPQWAPITDTPSRRQQRYAPTVDVLASSANTVAQRFFSRYYDSKAAAYDGLQQPWPINAQGSRQLYWIFPGPVSDALTSKVIRKLQEEQCDAILILPKYSKSSWVADLQYLPIRAKIELAGGRFLHGLYSPGTKAPPNLHERPPTRPLNAYFISWL